jgi:cobalamin biosynthesis Mg chelatase CobN
LLAKTLGSAEIDFLHGRVSTSVFMRNYFNPAWITDLKERAQKGVTEIKKNL